MYRWFWEPRLLRSASLMALVILCLSLLVMGFVLPRIFHQKAIEVGEGYAAQIAQNLNEIMFREFIPLHPETAFGKSYPNEVWQADMDRFVRGHISGLQIAKVKLFDRQGRVVYSTDRLLIGLKGPTNLKLQASLSGKIVSHFERKGEVWDIPGEEGPERDLIETYIPVFEMVPFWHQDIPVYKRGRVIGAFEIYQEVDTLYQAIGSLKRLLHFLAFGLLSLLILASLFLAFKGDRLIRTKSAALEAAELRGRRQQSWTEGILSSMDEGVAAVDKDYRITYLNGVVTRWFGQGLGEECYRVWNTRDTPCPDCINRKLLDGQLCRGTFTNVYHDKILDTVATMAEGPDGTRAVLRVMRDVTERVNREREIEEIKRAARRKLFEERVNTVRQMAVGLKHRLNNFLMGLMGVLSILSTEEPQLSEDSRLIIKRCQDEADSVRELIEKLPQVTDPVVADYLQGIQMIDLDRSIGRGSRTTVPDLES